MKILIVHTETMPVFAYGGTERVVWDLAKGLSQLGHQITLLAGARTACPFASVIEFDATRKLIDQIPAKNFDIVHFQSNISDELDYPYIVTEHGNSKDARLLCLNTIFISKNHAQRYGSKEFVYNGLDWSQYPEVDWDQPRHHFHFLGKAAWSVKNVRGAIAVARKAGVELDVLGGYRLNFKRGIRFTPWPNIRFHGMVGGENKFNLLNSSSGLIMPVRWHEPFGLAFIESLYFGCPIYSTPYGAVPELTTSQTGYLSNSCEDLAEAVKTKSFDRRTCHWHAKSKFDHLSMARAYLEKYERVINGESLNKVPPHLPNNGRKLLDWK
jgi:glycosyltransferase involved in cell wall biosynthesis